MTTIQTKWTSMVDSMEELGIFSPRIQMRVTEDLDGNEHTKCVLIYTSMGQEIVSDPYENKDDIRLTMITNYNINPGSPEYYMRRLFPLDLSLNNSEGKPTIFIYRDVMWSGDRPGREGFRGNLVGFTDEGVVVDHWEGRRVIPWSEASGAIVVPPSGGRSKSDWIAENPVNDLPLRWS